MQTQALLADRQRVLGPDHPQTLATRGSLASLLGETGRVEEAAAETQVLVSDYQRVLGHDDPDCLAVLAT